MSLYNMIFGSQPVAGLALALLDLTPKAVGRFRDAWFERIDGDVCVAVYTRNGGGNRDCWEEGNDDCTCTGCTTTRILPAHPLYISDQDDDFDCTYATFYFRLPSEPPKSLVGLLQMVKSGVKQDPIDTSERWQKALDSLKGDALIATDVARDAAVQRAEAAERERDEMAERAQRAEAALKRIYATSSDTISAAIAEEIVSPKVAILATLAPPSADAKPEGE